MKKYIDAEALYEAFATTEFLTMQDAATATQLVTEAPAADVIEMPFRTDGIAMIYSDTIKVTNVEALKDKTLKAVLFYVTQEESDRYDAEAERLIAAAQKA